MVYRGCHWDVVVAGFEGQVVEVGLAHELARDEEVEGDVTLLFVSSC